MKSITTLNGLKKYVLKSMGRGNNVSIHLPELTKEQITELNDMKEFKKVEKGFMGYVSFEKEKECEHTTE